jgi:hypothetical protein
MRGIAILSLVLLVACAKAAAPTVLGTDAGTPSPDAGTWIDAGSPIPVTTASPTGEAHVGALTVTLTSVPPAVITYTVTSTNPATSPSGSGQSPVVLTLDAPDQVTLTFYATSASGQAETPQTETYALQQDLMPASISGSLFAASPLATGQATVLLYDTNPTATGATPIGSVTVDPGDSDGAPYDFEGLPMGTYWVAAAWWPGFPSGGPQVFALAAQNPITVNPASSSTARVDFVNVYLAECDPSVPGVEGNVLLSSDLSTGTAYVAAYMEAPTLSSYGTQPIAEVGATGTGTSRPYALCGLPPNNVYLVAAASSSMAAAGVQTIDTVAPQNPIDAARLQHVDIYLGQQDTTLGSISGTIQLNGPLVGGTLSVIAGSGVASPADQNIDGLVTIAGGTSLSYPYVIPNLPSATYTLTLSVESPGGQYGYFPAGAMVTIALPSTANPTEDLAGAVGVISGTVTVTNEPNGHDILIGATPVGSQTPAATATSTLGAADSSGFRTASYTLFGLPDGTYNGFAIVDTTDTGDYTDAANNGAIGASTMTTTVSQGDTVTYDFTVALQTP